MVITYQLFLGFLITPSYSDLLSCLPEAVIKSFVNPSDFNYLQEIECEGRRYLGKIIENGIDLSSLELLQANIYSLLKRLVSDYPYENQSLVLFPIPLP